MKLSLPWKWFVSLAALLTMLLGITNVCIDSYLPPFLVEKIQEDLERDTLLTREIIAPLLSQTPVPLAPINALAHKLSIATGLRVTVIAPDGVVIGESDKAMDQLDAIENHLERPEIQGALRHGLGSATRHSATIGMDLLYVAVAVRENDQPTSTLHGFVRVALPLHQIQRTTARVRWIVAMASLAAALLALPLAFWMSRRITQPLLRMREMARGVAHGDFSKKSPANLKGELGELSTALNQMAVQLDARLRELAVEKADLAAVLASMTEGVLVVDATGKVRLANQALRAQFQIGEEGPGKTVLEVFRCAPLQELMTEASRCRDVVARELTFFNPGERFFAVHAVGLQSGDGSCAGVVAAFHDITRLKQLEGMRREFVANVSHELRTPLSVIKGYVETLLEEPPPDAATQERFLRTIQKHADRLEALIADLLTISALESQRAELHFEPLPLRAAIGTAVEELGGRIREKKMTVSLEIPPALPEARADGEKLRQVLVNLLDNAIKYTPTGGRLGVSVCQKGAALEICVADNGPGIDPGHLPHLFERFYRVDKARSRELGGTGLGLSIVKHIVEAHGGRVWVESQPGQGSRFFFTLPKI